MLGLFTTKAYAEPASQTPLLHRKLRRSSRAEDLIEGSHDYKAAVSLFDSFPKDELLAAPIDDLRRAVVALLGAAGPDRVRVLGRRAPRRPQRVADRRPARSRATTPSVARPPARRSSAARFGSAHGRRPRGPRRGRPRPGPLHRPRRRRPRRAVAARASSARSSDAHAHVGRPRCARRSSPRNGERGRVLAARWAKRASRAPTRRRSTRPPPRRTSPASSACSPPASRSSSACATSGEPAPAIGLYRIGGKLELSRAMPMLEHLGLRVIEERPDAPRRRRRGDVAAGLRRPRPDRPPARPRRGRRADRRLHRGRLARRRGVGLAQPPRDHDRPGLAPGRRSCAPTASTASASARASPRATRTT